MAYLVVSPVVIICDLFSRGKSLRKYWVVYYVAIVVIASVATWGVNQLLYARLDDMVVIVTGYAQLKERVDDVPYADLINYYALKNDLDPALVAAIIQRESGFRVDAVSPAGARGLMQLKPETWRQCAPESTCSGDHPPPARGSDCIYDPASNIRVGTTYFKSLLDAYEGNVVSAFAAYNAGPGRVDRYRSPDNVDGVPPIAETQNFVRDVMSSWAKLKRRQGGLERAGLAELEKLQSARDVLQAVNLGLWLVLLAWVVRRLERRR